MAGNSVCYASPEDLAVLGLPDDILKKVGGQSSPTVGRHLEAASGKIDSYLRSHHDLPIKQDANGNFPPELVSAAVDIAAYTLIQFTGYRPNNADNKFQQKYYDMVGNPNVPGSKGWLDRLSSGAVSLSQEVDNTPTKSEGAPRVITQPQRGWGLDNLGRSGTTFI